MWRLWHKLFGWDYALVEYGWSSYVRRIKKMPNGPEYVTLYDDYFFLPQPRSRLRHLTRPQ